MAKRIGLLLICLALPALSLPGCGGGTKTLCPDGTLVSGDGPNVCDKHGGIGGSAIGGFGS